MTEENNAQIASEKMVRNGQDLFAALYHQNQIFQKNPIWISRLDNQDREDVILNMWKESSEKAKISWIMLAQTYLIYHNPDYTFSMKGE